jgi:hypothetical protein
VSSLQTAAAAAVTLDGFFICCLACSELTQSMAAPCTRAMETSVI